MVDEFVGSGRYAAFEFGQVGLAGSKHFFKVGVGSERIDVTAAGKEVNGGVTVLGPGVDRHVRFGDDQYAGDTLGIVTMKD